MCSLDVQRTVCCNDMHFRCAAKLAAYLRNATPALHAALHAVLHAALHAFLMSFSFSNLFLDLSTQKRTQRCVQHYVAFVQRNVALHGLLQWLLHSV
jgi:hypothetical protein